MSEKMDKTDILKQMGISSLVLHSMDIWEVLDLLEKDNFGVEIHLNDFDAVIGNPEPLTHCGIWPRSFRTEDRERLKHRLESFPVVTIHGTPFDLNIAANNPGIREESIKQYEEAMDLARDVGCRIVTYHCGRASSSIMPANVYDDRHIEFAKRITERAESYGINTGFENGESPEFFLKIINAVNSPRWGHHLDIGHACLGGNCPSTATVLEWIDRIGKYIVEIHAHNVLTWSAVPYGSIDHQPFDRGTSIEMKPVFEKLKDIGCEAPIIFEILQNTAEKVIEESKRARDIIYNIWKN